MDDTQIGVVDSFFDHSAHNGEGTKGMSSNKINIFLLFSSAMCQTSIYCNGGLEIHKRLFVQQSFIIYFIKFSEKIKSNFDGSSMNWEQ